MGRKKDVIAGVESAQPYSWDGNSRPRLEDYTAPWANYANLDLYQDPYSFSRKQKFNDAVLYARTMMDIASSQYKDDLSFWQEQDTRSYNSPLSASSRYEDAGFNMGYMYSNVDAGYSDGYAQNDYSPYVNEGRNDDKGKAQKVMNVVSSVHRIALDILSQGIALRKVPYEVNKLISDANLNSSSAALRDVEAGMKSLLLTHNSSGEPVENSINSMYYEMSLATLVQSWRNSDNLKANSDYMARKAQELTKWLNEYAVASWEKATAKTSSEYLMTELEKMDIPQWAKTALVLIAAMGSHVSMNLKP